MKKKFLLILLTMSVAIAADCKDLMNSKHICSLKKTNLVSKDHCGKQKKSTTKDCNCPSKKSISIQDSEKDTKNSLRVELILASPINVSYSNFIAEFVRAKYFQDFQKPAISYLPTKTIHLLI